MADEPNIYQEYGEERARGDLMAKTVQDLRAALLKVLELPAGGVDGTAEARHIACAALVPGLIAAITQALIADPRDVVTVYAELVSDGPWKAVWNALSIAERNAVVAAARKEAGR